MTDKQKKYLAIGGAAVVGYLLYRHQESSSSSSSSSPLAASNAANSQAAEGSLGNADTQSPVVLTSGESVYDPNTEGLLNTPGALATSPDTTQPDVTTPQASAAASPGYTINVNYPATATAKKVTKKAATRKPTVKKKKTTKKKKS